MHFKIKCVIILFYFSVINRTSLSTNCAQEQEQKIRFSDVSVKTLCDPGLTRLLPKTNPFRGTETGATPQKKPGEVGFIDSARLHPKPNQRHALLSDSAIPGVSDAVGCETRAEQIAGQKADLI